MANSLNPPHLFVDTDGTAFTGTCRIKSITVSNSAGAAAEVIIYDNTAASGVKIMQVELLDQTPFHAYYGEKGLPCDIGIQVDLVAGMFVTILLA